MSDLPREVMERVTPEAMAAERPVIGYNSDGTAELVDHKDNGLLYDRSTEDLSDCMRRFVDNPSFAQSLGENGLEKASKAFTNEMYASKVYNVLKKISC